MLKNIIIPTHARTEMINIDNQVSRVVRASGIQEGICMLWVPHTTAAVTINENADPNVVTNGELLLGTWQSVFFCEFDGPRSRKLYIKIWEA